MSTAACPRAAFRHVPELDGVRGIAVFLVVVFHFGGYAAGGGLLDRIAVRGAGLGWSGVDLFFVLSGCLITGILLDSKGSPHYLRSFYMRRVLRILPLYYLSVAAFFWLALPLAGQAVPSLRELAPVPRSEQLWYWLHLSNWRSAFGTFAHSPIGHFWSLAIEEQFYFFWPLVVLLVKERALLALCPLLVAASIALRNVGDFQTLAANYPEFLYRLTPFRMEALACGASIAVLLRKPGWRAALRRAAPALCLGGMAAVLLAVGSGHNHAYWTPQMSRFGYSGFALFYSGLVLFAALESGSRRPAVRALRSPILTSLGKYSYAIYVLHIPMAYALYETGVLWPARSLAAAVYSVAVGLAASWLLALLSWNLVEKHFLKLKDRFPY